MVYRMHDFFFNRKITNCRSQKSIDIIQIQCIFQGIPKYI